VVPVFKSPQTLNLKPRTLHQVARLLLDNGADVSAKTPGGETAEDIATAGFYLHLATMLKAAAANNKEEE